MEDYELGAKPGYYIIFDHENFWGAADWERKGTDADVAAVRDTFDALGFEGHETVVDASQNEISIILKEVFSRNFDDYGSVFVFILTHGGRGYTLEAYDVHYQFSNLLEEAMKSASDSLRDKPKVFIVQACGGTLRDHGTAAAAWSTGDPESINEYSPHPFLLPRFPHVLLAFASSPGYVSLRNFFIPILCLSISRYAAEYDFQTLLKLTRRKVTDITMVEDQLRSKQVPILISTLTKKLRLPLRQTLLFRPSVLFRHQ